MLWSERNGKREDISQNVALNNYIQKIGFSQDKEVLSRSNTHNVQKAMQGKDGIVKKQRTKKWYDGHIWSRGER